MACFWNLEAGLKVVRAAIYQLGVATVPRRPLSRDQQRARNLRCFCAACRDPTLAGQGDMVVQAAGMAGSCSVLSKVSARRDGRF